MNEIDDMYKQETEDLDTNFLESLKDKKSTKKSWDNYLKEFRGSREKFEKKYAKNLEKEKWKIYHPKKERKKKEEFKHLEVSHFDFEFNFFQRTWFSINVFFFKVVRFFSRLFVKIIPKLLMYIFFKLTKTVRFYYRAFMDWISLKKTRAKDKTKKLFIKLVEEIKNLYAKSSKEVKSNISKLEFWKKKDEGDEEGEEGESGDGDKDEEKKDEKEEKKDES